MAKNDDIGGVWRTIGGRRVFIKDGQNLSDAMKSSGKFNKRYLTKQETNVYKETNEAGKVELEKRANKREQEEEGKRYKEKLKSLKGREDGTYDLDTGNKVDFGNKGYNVSFEQSSDNYSASEYYEKILECKNKCDGKVYGGVFGGDPEISFYTKDIKVAKEIMYKYNQHSIWSNELQDIIKNEKYDEKKNKTNYK